MTAPTRIYRSDHADERWDVMLEEYEFMRDAMGRDHREACERIGTTVDAFDRRASRRRYQYQP